MPRTLLLLRHAKSDWADETLTDFHRPLNERGHEAGLAMGHYLHTHELRPDYILCSASRRTRDTLDLVTREFDNFPETRLTRRLYLAPPQDMLNVINSAPSSARTLMVISHNPGIHGLAFELLNRANSPAGPVEKLDEKYPTCGLAVFSFDTETWNLPRGGGYLSRFIRPRDIE